MQIKIKKLSENAKIPFRGSKYAAGYDLFAAEDAVIYAGQRKLIKTDIAIEIPEGYFGWIAPRSGLALKNGIMTMAGILDSDYRGQIGIILFNSNFDSTWESNIISSQKTKFEVKVGDRIGQLILKRYEEMEFIEVQELSDSARAENGFGSSGLK